MVTRLATVALACLVLAGCGASMAGLEGAPKPPTLKVTGDTFCRQTSYVDPETGERRFIASWEPRDSPATIHGIETLGAKYEKVCERPGKLPALK